MSAGCGSKQVQVSEQSHEVEMRSIRRLTAEEGAAIAFWSRVDRSPDDGSWSQDAIDV